MGSSILDNNPTWGLNATTTTLPLTPTSAAATSVAQLELLGSYCIISNAGAVNVYIGTDADGSATITPGTVTLGGPGVLLEPNASMEFAVEKGALIFVRNMSATTQAQVAALWFA